MSDIVAQALWAYMYASLVAIAAASLYGIVARPNIVKKIIALTILADTGNTFMIFIGYRLGSVTPPILTTHHPLPADIATFVSLAVDPVPQCLVITAIVINMAITVFLVFLAIQVHRIYGTLDARRVSRLRG
ncbi:MAG: sodium:proton antiporter [Candidatus Nezhaarchaeota archaeon]|nr:sodium:proton antiporter [Candidatus Nezhaarchaeota archaeon]